MKMSRSSNPASKTKVIVLTADSGFEEQARLTFGASEQIVLKVLPGTLAALEGKFEIESATVVVIDLDASETDEMQALERLMARIGAWPPVVVVTQKFDESVARTLLQMRVADFMVKPVSPVELVRTCARVAKGPANTETTESQIYTFLPAVGGAGVTTLAVQSAMMLLNSGQRGKSTTCLVDLDFQHGACADYLDLEPRLNLSEIEGRPERLDRQLLEIMLSHHPSGLAVIAAPNRPAEMRSFDPDVVTRLLDMVSSNFDYVVFDMPRTWFSWTDSVLLGSNKLFIISEMTVPGLRHAKQLVEAIHERLGDTPKPQVIVNRFEQKLFSSGLRKGDIEQVLGDSFAACIPNHYGLVREAIDRGVPLDEIKPGNKITMQLRSLILPQPSAKAAATEKGAAKKFKLSWAR
ncbi:MAG: pilus assembly protein CpaE [Alphaproteobacteria bacterium]|jgi:pilus assembly protein CpaE|nr:pilus assembly protein CpaE [Alphaproteobacteria bacterium]